MASLGDLVLFTLVGRIFVYLWMSFPLPLWVDMSRFGKLHTCSLCSSVWIFSIIFILFRVDLLFLFGLPVYPTVGEIISGGVIAYLVNLLEIGFFEKFLNIVIE